jgi:hypothetical protein
LRSRDIALAKTHRSAFFGRLKVYSVRSATNGIESATSPAVELNRTGSIGGMDANRNDEKTAYSALYDALERVSCLQTSTSGGATRMLDPIAVDLELEAQEKNVGPFRADILCKDTDTGNWVLIENQLERTDHVHLGQLLTYAAGLQAVTVVWVAAQFTDEHRATLDWLNDITDDTFRFFGLEIELWQIGESKAAPKFNIVSKPNDWTRSVGQSARRISDEALTETKVQQRAYWTSLRDYLRQRNSSIRSQKPLPQHWSNFGIGRSGFHLAATIHSREHRLGVDLYINGDRAKDYYNLLHETKADIEADLGTGLDWKELPDRKASRIALFKQDSDPTNELDWPAQHEWIASTLECFDRVFRQRVKALDPDDWHSEGG